MRVSVPIFVQDRWAAERENIKPIEHFYIKNEDSFQDGPATRRLAVRDIDGESGQELPGARFLPPTGRRKTGRYEIADEKDLTARDLNQVCAFSAVVRALEMFEEKDAMGRRISWAFGEPQLEIIPRAGHQTNAYYDRETHSLKFFYFADPKRPGETVYTSLSRDIVAHEAGHAILDGIAPHLYHAVTPQSLALHEGVADLVAVLTGFRSQTLREAVLKRTQGSIENSTEFSAIAEEFGAALDETGLAGFLRNLNNNKTLDPNDRSVDAQTGQPNLVSRQEPHALCEVLTGAIYTTLIKAHRTEKKRLALEHEADTDYSFSGLALFKKTEVFKRLILRGLDYLAPGEVSFADYARALLAADQAAHPDDSQEREWLKEEFVRRRIAPNRSALDVDTNYDHPALHALDFNKLLENDGLARQFAEHNRQFLQIPPGIPFQVAPRLKVTKTYYHLGSRQQATTELLFKVSWLADEPNDLGSQFARQRRLAVGSTLAVDWNTRLVRALLTTAPAVRPDEAARQKEDRDHFLGNLIDKGLVQPGLDNHQPGSTAPPGLIGLEETNGVLRLQGMTRMLHINRPESSDRTNPTIAI